MKIIVVGTRGIPNILGGIERHCEELYPVIAEKFEANVTIICRSCYVENRYLNVYKGVRLKNIYAPRNRSLEAIVHTFLSICYAAYKRPDILHVHAIGPSLLVPLAKILRLKVVMTHHGPDYDRKKWGLIARLLLRAGEWAGVRFSDYVIAISSDIKKELLRKFKINDITVIPNGTLIARRPEYSNSYLKDYDLVRYKYIFALGRFVPEKGFDYLIKAFKNSTFSDKYKLVIAGDADHECDYSRSLKKMAKDMDVILTGFISGDRLAQIFSNCCLFILPSFYEGLPISILEAMGYKLPILASDIDANTQIGLPKVNYFKVGSESELKCKIESFLNNYMPGKEELYHMGYYNWTSISFCTNEVYRFVL